MINLPEIVIIVIIVMIVFGVGKVGNIGAHLGRAKKEFRKGLAGEAEAERTPAPDVIDITPTAEGEDPSYDPKPGTRREPIEDAEVESSA